MTSLTSTLTARLVDDVSGPARAIAKSLRDAEKAMRSTAKAMTQASPSAGGLKGFASMKTSARDINAAGRAWRSYAVAAASAARATGAATNTAAIRAWRRETVDSIRAVEREQRRIRGLSFVGRAPTGRFAPTVAPTQGQVAPVAGKHGKGGKHAGGGSVVVAGELGAGTIAGLGAGYLSHEAASEILKHYREADAALRYQAAMADLTPADMASRLKQAQTLGPRMGFKPADVLHAQQTLAGRGVKKEFVEPFVEQLAHYARAKNQIRGEL